MHEALAAVLHNRGYSLTKPRKKVFDLLCGQEPQSMQVLAERAKPFADRATVYRIIELFEKLGIVNRINIGWKYRVELSDAFSDHHHYFYCTKCQRAYVIPSTPILENLIDATAGKAGFASRSHQLTLSGHCPSCQS